MNMKTKSIYFTGEARTTMDNAITKIYGTFYMAFEVDASNGKIIRTDCNGTMKLTKDFINRIFEGKIFDDDEEKIIEEISEKYYASSTRAIVVAYRDALQKYKKVKKDILEKNSKEKYSEE